MLFCSHGWNQPGGATFLILHDEQFISRTFTDFTGDVGARRVLFVTKQRFDKVLGRVPKGIILGLAYSKFGMVPYI